MRFQNLETNFKFIQFHGGSLEIMPTVPLNIQNEKAQIGFREVVTYKKGEVVEPGKRRVVE